MKITFISSLPPIKGISPYTINLLDALAEKINISFLGFNKIYPPFLHPAEIYDNSSKEYKNKNVTTKNVLNWYDPIGWFIEAFKIKTKIIHAQLWSFPLLPIYTIILGINKLRGKKIILTIHNIKLHEQNTIINLLNKIVLFLGDEYIVHTKQNKDELKKIIKDKKIHIIPHGIIKHTLTNINKKQARTRLNINQNDKILLFFGHIREYKGLDIALKSLKLLQNKNIKLLIAGQCWENWKKYEKIIKDNNLQNNVILKTNFIPKSKIEIIFKASDILVLPYKRFDAQSGVGALALNFKIPILVSNVGGLVEYAASNKYITTPNNPAELAEKIQIILNEPKGNIEINKNNFNWGSISEKTIQIYNNQ
jgi:glycosyltransferase involved in cell wall biosynthesis